MINNLHQDIIRLINTYYPIHINKFINSKIPKNEKIFCLIIEQHLTDENLKNIFKFYKNHYQIYIH